MKYKIEIVFDEDEKNEMLNMLSYERYFSALFEVEQELRQLWKYSDKNFVKIEDARNRFYEITNKYGIES